MNDIIPQTLIIFLFTSVVVTVRVRRPIRLRPPPDWVAFAVRSVRVRRPIRLRTGDDDFCKRLAIVRIAFGRGKAHTSFCRQLA